MGVALGSITLSPALFHMTLVLWMHSLYTHLAPQVKLKLYQSLRHYTVAVIVVIWSCMSEYFIFILYLADPCSAEFTCTVFLEGLSRGCSLKLVILSAASEIGWGAWLLAGRKTFPLSTARTRTVVVLEIIT